jgi:hypothetical protein
MIGLPGEPLRGQPVRASDTAGILRYLKSTAPRSAPGTYSTVGAGGSTRRPIHRPRWQWPLAIQPATQGALWVYDASSGATPRISVTPGAFNGTIIPTLGGNAINVQIGSPLAWPTLEVGTGTTYCWFEVTYSSSNVPTTVLINTGGSIPASVNGSVVTGTGGTDYVGLSTLVATVTGGKASVQCLNDFISGNLWYSQCAPNVYLNSV